MKLTDWLLALFSGGLVIVSALQWWEIRSGSADTHALAEASKKQAEASSQNAKTTYELYLASSRAWISLTNPVIKYPKLGENIKAYQEYGNVGHSPALVANGWFGRMYDNGEYNRDFLEDVQKAKGECLARTVENSNVLGVRFPGNDRLYYFNFNNINYRNEPILVDEDFLAGRSIFVFHECFVYKVGDDTKHTYMCSLFEMPKKQPAASVNEAVNSTTSQPPSDGTPNDKNTDSRQDINLEDCPQGSFAD